MNHARIQALDALRHHFGFDAFRPGQLQVVLALLGGRDALVVIPTGGGKSLCYQVPALVKGGLTIVISPLISLMKDQVDALERRGIAATYINSSLPPLEQHERLVRVLRGEVTLLYVAPERLGNAGFLKQLRDRGVSLFAVDEAHCISEWGHEFRPSYRRIADARAALGAPPTIALTATATPAVRADIRRELRLRDPFVAVTGFDRRNLSYRVIEVKRAAEKRARIARLALAADGVTVVYASTRRDVEAVSRLLRDARIAALAYHAGLEPRRRRRIQDAFLAEEIRVIVATNAFGMGIDKPNVRRVVHFAMPASLEAYYQEAGRAGRDGQPAECILLHAFADRFTHEFFIRATIPERQVIEKVQRAARRLEGTEGTGGAGVTAAAIATASGVGERETGGALAILTRGTIPAGRVPVASVRLLATDRRLGRELADHPMARDLAAIVARSGGSARLALDQLPPGFGGPAAVMRLLDELQRRQFLAWSAEGSGLLVPPTLDRIDWEALDRRRAAERARLDAMQGYAYTRRCRRFFVLRYFGDTSARDACGNCDNCEPG